MSDEKDSPPPAAFRLRNALCAAASVISVSISQIAEMKKCSNTFDFSGLRGINDIAVDHSRRRGYNVLRPAYGKTPVCKKGKAEDGLT